MSTFTALRSVLRGTSNLLWQIGKLSPGRMASSVATHIVGPEQEPAGTMAEVKEKMMKSLGLAMDYSPLPRPRDYLTKYEPKPEDLPPRSMSDSLTCATIPLSTDMSLKDKYVTFLGHVRLGRLMEDMDLFAVWVCHQHLKINNFDHNVPLPYTFVTILVDKVDFTHTVPRQDQDIRLKGHVSWVGRSSIEIVVWLEQEQGGQWRKITSAVFLMAARDATNSKAALVNPLKPANEEEASIAAGGEERKRRRMKVQNDSLLKVQPNEHEQRLIHDIFTRTIPPEFQSLNKRVIPRRGKWMEDSRLSNLIFSHPENRNAHNKVFGGFLMRNALEVSWACAYFFCKQRPKLEHICDISFHKPVEVSSFIQMTSHVVYTELNYIQVITIADIFDPQTGEQHTTNTFYCTFSDYEPVAPVFPKTYHEAMWYLEGRRKMHYALGNV